MFCQNCGAENKDTARFCNDCGSLILRAAPVRRRQPRVLTASAPETEPRARAAMPERMPKAEALKADIPKAAVPLLQASSTPVKRTPRKIQISEPSSPPPEPPRAKSVPQERAQRLETFTPALGSGGDASITWPSVDASPMQATGDQLFSGKPQKPTGRADAEKFTILIALAVVVIAIIAVGAGGYYLYTHDPAPPPAKAVGGISTAHPAATGGGGEYGDISSRPFRAGYETGRWFTGRSQC